MSWIVFLKMGKHLPRLYTVKLATIFTADECAETILRFINAHVPGARELVAFSFILETIIIFIIIINDIIIFYPLLFYF